MPPQLFAVDPGPHVLRWGWFLWVTWAVVGVGLLSEDTEGGAFAVGAVLSAPFWALWVLWPVYRGWALWARWTRHTRWKAWQGSHYEFDGRHVRVLLDDEQVWFAAEDVFDALGLQGRQRDPERAQVVAGRDGVSRLPDSGLLVFSEAGLFAWLDRRTDPDAVKFGRWVRQQVIEPYRRRRERGTA